MVDIVGNKNLRDLWDELDNTHNEKTALIFHGCDGKKQLFSYSELNKEINKTANLFIDLGVKKGERVAVQLNNSPEFLMCWFGLAKIGAVIVPINTDYVISECDYIINKCGDIATVVTEEEYLPNFTFEQSNRTISNILLIKSNKEIPGTILFTEEKDKQPEELKEYRPLSSNDEVEILFTSGTTSKPKGAVLTHANMIFAGLYAAWQLSISKEDRFLNTMPVFHIDLQMNTIMPCITTGATIILLEKYSASRFWKQVCSYRATITECIPMMIRTLMLQPERDWEKDHCLRTVYYYLVLTDKEKEAFENRFNVQLQNSYGSTEVLVGVIGDPPHGNRKWPSIGKVGLFYEAKIVDENGNELPPYEIGEICIKGIPGRTIMKEYLHDPEATKETLKPDGWFLTGDKGYVDEDGWFYFVDRKVNMIKRSGENISSSEVENVLESHPKIAEAAVIGVPDPIRDEAVKAFVRLKTGEELSKSEILEYCQNRLAKFKVPSIIEFVETFPRTRTGKIKKFMLNKEPVSMK